MKDHEVDHRNVLTVFTMARTHVEADPFGVREDYVRSRVLKLVHAAFRRAFPSMGRVEMALLMSVDDVKPYVHREDSQIPLWWYPPLIERMADVLNVDRIRPAKPKPAPKPVPAEMLADPALPRCGPKRDGAIPVIRKPYVAKPKRVFGIAKPWEPEEVRRPVQSGRQQPLPHHAYGDPAPGRSALDERLRARALAEVRA